MCGVRDNLWMLEVGRLLQGLGAGSASVLGRSVLRDSYDGKELTKALSYISVTASIMPIVAPVLGGWITFQFGWIAVFSFVLLYLSSIFALGLLILPETLPYSKKPFQPLSLFHRYASLLADRQVMSSASYNWLTYLAAVVSLSIFPFLLQTELGLTAAEYGTIMILPSMGLLFGSLALNVLNRYYATGQILAFSITVLALAGFCLLSLEMSVFNLVFSFTLLALAQGLSFPLSISMLLAPHKKNAGTVSAFSGSIQMCLAGVFGGYIVTNWINSALLLGVFYFVVAGTMAFVLLFNRPYEMEKKLEYS